MVEYLVLDPAIRDWVVLPMVLMIMLVGVGRHYVQLLIKGDEQGELETIRNRQTAGRAQMLRMNRASISEEAFASRRAFLCQKKTGLLRQKVTGAPNPMNDMSGMMNMMKGNMTFMLPNMVMMAFVSYFFAGFILVKIPFPLPSNGFKLMLQRGVDLTTLDVSYVSSLSWYFLVTFGLQGFYRLLLGEDAGATDEARMMQMQMGGMGGGQFDATAAFRQEREMLMLTKYTCGGSKAEQALLGKRHPHAAVLSNSNARYTACILRYPQLFCYTFCFVSKPHRLSGAVASGAVSGLDASK